MQTAAKLVYDYVQEFWGEALTEGLAVRISDASASELQKFADGWPASAPGSPTRLPDLPSGELRPIYSNLASDEELDALPLQLLLYTPSVVVEGRVLAPLRLMARDEVFHPDMVFDRMAWLAAVKPLVESGSILFAGKGVGRHPSLSHGVVKDVWSIDKEEWIAAGIPAGEINGPGWDSWRSSLLYEISGNVNFARYRKATPTALSAVEELAYSRTLGLQRREDNRLTRLSTLSRTTVPSLAPDVKTLISVRENDELFSRWRTGLSNALAAVGEIQDTDDAFANARAIIADELKYSLSEFENGIKRSPALSGMRRGLKTFGLSALGAVAEMSAELAIGLPPLPLGTASMGALMTVADLRDSYKASQTDRDQSKAVWDLILSFGDAPVPR